MSKTAHISLRLPQEVLDRADEVVARLEERATGPLDKAPTRSDVLRLALERGLDVLKTEQFGDEET